MNQKKTFFIYHFNILLLLISFVQFPLTAQSKVLTLDDAINIALSKNRDIAISVLNVKKASAAVDQAFGYALPSVDLSGSFSRFLKKPLMSFPDFGTLLQNATYAILFDEHLIPQDNNKYKPVENILQSFSQANNFSTGITITQTLFSSTVFKGIGASHIYFDLAKSELDNTVSKSVLSVQKAFYGVLLAKEVLKITEESFINAKENFDNVSALYRQGIVSEFDMLQAEVQVENVRPVVLQMENILKSAKDGLKIILGIDQTEDIDINGEFTYQPYDVTNEEGMISEALTSNLDIKSLNLKKQVDEAFIQLDVANYWPTVSAFGNYTYAGASDTWDFQNYSSATVGLNLSINLWQGNRTKNAVEQSTITFEQTEQQLNQLKEYTILSVKAKIQELKRVQLLLETQEQTVKIAERAFHIANVRYKEGAGSQLEIQNADQALKQARLNRIQSINSYLTSKYELEQLLGKTNPAYFSNFNELKD